MRRIAGVGITGLRVSEFWVAEIVRPKEGLRTSSKIQEAIQKASLGFRV